MLPIGLVGKGVKDVVWFWVEEEDIRPGLVQDVALDSCCKTWTLGFIFVCFYVVVDVLLGCLYSCSIGLLGN